ncbi:MAG TPA: HAD family hydrolase [Candidatus Cryptobacteroides pullicola]|nr:HAD family hydrolase [Candidatus Cryptobacteroides pullicola]
MTKNLIFDFDGTLVDTCEGIVHTEMETFRRLGLPAPPREDIVGAIGLPLELSLEKGGGLDRQTAVRAAAIYRSLFNEVAAPHITMFPGVYETLESLRGRGLRMAIATSRGTDSLGGLLDAFNLRQFFELILTAGSGCAPKPSPEMVLRILGALHFDPDETIVVGDTTFDLQMGQGAACRVCGVSYGNHSRERLASVRPDYIIDAFPELSGIVA